MVNSLDSATAQFGRLSPARPEWLASALDEPAVLAPLDVIDTHFHVWENGSYTMADYAQDCATGHRVAGSIYVECGNWYRPSGPEALRSVGETEAIALIAADRPGASPPIVGIVPRVDLTSGPRVQEVIEGHLDVGGSLIGAFRDGGAYDADPAVGNAFFVDSPGRYTSEDFADGLAVLGRYGIAFEAWAFFTQLDEVYELARRFSDTTVVLEHTGGPLGYGPYTDRREDVFAVWDRRMTRLATCDNVVVKLGGLMIRLAAFDYRTSPRPATSAELVEAWSPYLDRTLELFGAHRCMAESNYPVERAGATFKTVLNALKLSVAEASHAEQRAIFSANAMRVYGIAASQLTRNEEGAA